MKPPAFIGRASRKWEASTAYGCASRGAGFDPVAERQAWEAFVVALGSYWPEWR